MATANRTRDLFGDDIEPLFEQNQSIGGWWITLANTLVQRERRVQLTDAAVINLDLEDETDWSGFIADQIEGDGSEPSRQWAERCWDRLGIPFTSLVRFLDDVAVAPEDEKHFDARLGSPLAELWNLYGNGERYARLEKLECLLQRATTICADSFWL